MTILFIFKPVLLDFPMFFDALEMGNFGYAFYVARCDGSFFSASTSVTG